MSKIEENYLVVLTGPTGVGKTELAVRLSKDLNGSIISADSRQVYKELTIGTAKPSKEQIEQGPITLVDHTSVSEPYSAGIFEKEAIEAISVAQKNGKLPILCGGTGLYLRAVCEGLDEFPEVPESFLETIKSELKAGKAEQLKKEIEEKDPVAFAKMDKHNLHRVTRILSVIRCSGKTYSSFLDQPKTPRSFTPIYVVLERPREELYERINLRVLSMVERGLFDEVKSLLPLRELQALNTVSYSEVFHFLDGKFTKEKCISEIQKNTRRYAKRQLTWFRNQMKAEHFPPSDYEGIKNYILEKTKTS